MAFCSITRVFQELSAKDVDPGRRARYQAIVKLNAGRAIACSWSPSGVIWIVRGPTMVAQLIEAGVPVGAVMTISEVSGLAGLVGDPAITSLRQATAYLSAGSAAGISRR